MNSILDRALAVLTRRWQRLPALNLAAGFGLANGTRGFHDLCEIGYAEKRCRPILRHGIPCGYRLYYRRARK